MSACTFSRPKIGRTYRYYVRVAGAYLKRDTCSAQTDYKVEEVEVRICDVVSGILEDPERLRVGLDYRSNRKDAACTTILQPRRRDGWRRSRKRVAIVPVIRRWPPKG
jgi:hypothetical protein